MSALRLKTTILDRSISKGKNEVNFNAFALLFSEIIQYCQNRVSTVPELQAKYLLFLTLKNLSNKIFIQHFSK